MNEFILLFRRDFKNPETQPSPARSQSMMTEWQNWLGGIAAQDKLVDTGNRLADEGAVVIANNQVVNGPYVDIKEGIGGYTIVRAESLSDAVELAKGCPITTIGGNVEVRQLVPPNL